MQIYYHLPGLWEKFNFYQLFLCIYTQEREKFYDWAEIGSIYGCPQECLWNGGRGRQYITPNHEDVIAFLDYFDLSCSFTYTNSKISEGQLGDHYSNLFLYKYAKCGKGENSIIVNSPVLEEYLRENFPEYKLVSSVTKCITDKKLIRQEFKKDYDKIVLDYRLNRNQEFIKELAATGKIKLWIDPMCKPDCQCVKQHYEAIDELCLLKHPSPISCERESKPFFERMKNPNFISVTDIEQIYIPLGVTDFKMCGRGSKDYELLEQIVYYMVKPEYRLEIRQIMNCALDSFSTNQ